MKKVVILSVVSSLFIAIAQIALKKASDTLDLSHVFGVIGNLPLWLGTASYVVAFVSVMGAYRYGELSVVFPLSSLCYVWNIFFAHLWLDESLTLGKILGTILIGFGSLLIAFEVGPKTRKKL